jgi:hypothetical protein
MGFNIYLVKTGKYREVAEEFVGFYISRSSALKKVEKITGKDDYKSPRQDM